MPFIDKGDRLDWIPWPAKKTVTYETKLAMVKTLVAAGFSEKEAKEALDLD